MTDAENSNNSPSDRQQLQSQGQVGTPMLANMDLSGNGSSSSLSGMDPSLSGVRTAKLATESGFHGVAGAAGVDVVDATTEAYIGNNATVNGSPDPGADPAQSVLVGAGDDFYHLALA